MRTTPSVSFFDIFTPLKSPNFRLYMGGQSISLIGSWMQTAAQAWVLQVITNDERIVGLATALGFLPLFFITPFSGVLADRLDRRRVLIVTNALAMVLAFTMAALVWSNGQSPIPILVIALLLGIVSAVSFPAEAAFIGDLSGMEQIRKAAQLNATMIQLGRMLGPAIAGLAIRLFGAALAFLLNGVSYLFVITSLFKVRTSQQIKKSGAKPLAELAEAFRYVGTQPRIIDLILFTIIVTFFVISTGTLFPALTRNVFNGDADAFGLLTGASGAGAVVGALFVAPQIQRFKRIGVAFAAMTIWAALNLILTGLNRSFPLALLFAFLTSISLPTVIAGANGLIQMLAPPNMRARMVSVWIMASFGSQPLAGIAAGVVSRELGVLAAITLNGVLMLIAGIALITLRKGLRAWEIARPEGPPSGPARPVGPPGA
jgi:MFS family permease